MVPGAWGSAGGTAQAVLLGVVAPKMPPTLLLTSPSPSWTSGQLLTKLGGCGVATTHPTAKGSAFAPWQRCPHPKGRFAAVRGCSSHTVG